MNNTCICKNGSTTEECECDEATQELKDGKCTSKTPTLGTSTTGTGGIGFNLLPRNQSIQPAKL